MDYDKTDMPEKYNLGRDHGPAVLLQWMDAIAERISTRMIRNIIDLGCGTGRFSGALASRFKATVIGVDPSRKMLKQAQAGRTHSQVFYACGAAEAIPIPSNSVDLVFISMALHHFSDPRQAARECRRVLREHGRVFLRTASRENISMYAYVPFFPTSRPVLEQRIPSLDFQCDVFKQASFQILSSGVVTQQIATDYSDYADKLAVRADSILLSLDDEAFNAGLKAVRCEKSAGPITEPIDYVVFE